LKIICLKNKFEKFGVYLYKDDAFIAFCQMCFPAVGDGKEQPGTTWGILNYPGTPEWHNLTLYVSGLQRILLKSLCSFKFF
jgi:hypothetical protein